MKSRLRIERLWPILLIATMAVLVSACSGLNAQSNKQSNSTSVAAAPPPLEVTTAAAIQRQLPRYFEATGSFAGDEQTDVAPTIAGKVVDVRVDLGSFVQKGAVLVTLDDRDSKIRLDQAMAQLEQAKAAVAQAEAKINIRPGQKFDPERVPDVGAARATLDNAEKQLKRYENLIESGDVSRSTLDQQKSQRDQYRELYEVALNNARQNYAAVLSARAAVTTADTQVAQAKKAIADAVVLAPIAGYVVDRPADVGEYVSTSSKIATIVRTNKLRVRIDIPEQALTSVKVGQSVSVNVSAYLDREFTGHIARISPSVTATSRTLSVEAEVDNSAGQLKPGEFATVRILQPQGEPAVLIPARAVRTESGSSRVFVVKDGRAEQRLVQLGQVEGDLIEIRSGVSANEKIATSNLDKLSDGVAVRQ